MHRADIKAALEKKGWTSARIARRRGVRPSTVSMVISGRGKSLPIARFISRITGHPVSQLWPGKYAESQKTLAV